MSEVYHYDVADCEHEGDLRDAVEEVEEAGGVVDEVYWDGHDCGEAYVAFIIPLYKDKKAVLKKLHLQRKI